MMKPQHFGSVLAGFALLCMALAWNSDALAGGRKSDGQVKATAKASTPDGNGKQTVSISLDINKGWHLYANPVNHEFLENGQTKVTISAKLKPVSVAVKYPEGKKVVDGKDVYNIYEGKVNIEATVQRAAGDNSPLEISILVQACTNKECLQPGTVKLTVP